MADETKTRTKNDQAEANASDVQVNTDSVEQAFAEANEKGYFGQVPDETPNSEYTVAGVTKKAGNDGK